MNGNGYGPINRRGPRVMHGAAALLGQAKDLSHLSQSARQALSGVVAARATPSGSLPLEEATKLVEALTKAEARVANVEAVIAAFQKQCDQMPAGDPARAMIEQVLATFRQVIAAVDATSVSDQPDGG